MLKTTTLFLLCFFSLGLPVYFSPALAANDDPDERPEANDDARHRTWQVERESPGLRFYPAHRSLVIVPDDNAPDTSQVCMMEIESPAPPRQDSVAEEGVPQCAGQGDGRILCNFSSGDRYWLPLPGLSVDITISTGTESETIDIGWLKVDSSTGLSHSPQNISIRKMEASCPLEFRVAMKTISNNNASPPPGSAESPRTDSNGVDDGGGMFPEGPDEMFNKPWFNGGATASKSGGGDSLMSLLDDNLHRERSSLTKKPMPWLYDRWTSAGSMPFTDIWVYPVFGCFNGMFRFYCCNCLSCCNCCNSGQSFEIDSHYERTENPPEAKPETNSKLSDNNGAPASSPLSTLTDNEAIKRLLMRRPLEDLEHFSQTLMAELQKLALSQDQLKQVEKVVSDIVAKIKKEQFSAGPELHAD